MGKLLFDIKDFTYSDSGDPFHINVEENEIHSLLIKDSSEQELFVEKLQTMEEEGEDLFVADKQQHSSPYIYGGKKRSPIHFLHKTPLTIDNLTVSENVNLMYLPKFRFLPFLNWGRINNNTTALFNKLNMNYVLKDKLYDLSGEDKKMIYLCRVLLSNPHFIAMHEPIENLSSANATKMYTIMKHFKENGGGILFITKQWEDALKISDRISILNKGELIETMSASEAKADPQLFLQKIEGYQYKETDEVNEDSKKFLDTVFKAAEFLTSEYELKDVLLLLAKEVSKFMNADGCAIRLLDEDTWNTIDNFEYQVNSDINVELSKETIINIAKSNEIFYINQRDKSYDSFFEKNNKVNTFICVPVLIRSQVTGLISIYYDHFYVYSKEESRYLSALAKHAAIAIEDTRLMGNSTLLQESHHRIKNNLQSIIGLVTLQKTAYKQEEDRSIDELLDNVINRIKSIATVHDLLSKDRMGRSIINLTDLIQSLIKVSSSDPRIEVSLDLEDIFIPYNKATSIALVINELVINSYKHAFEHMESGLISIKSSKIADSIVLNVRDNGKGLPADFDLENTNSLGLNILRGIIQSELRGEISVDQTTTDGSAFIVTLPSKHLFASE